MAHLCYCGSQQNFTDCCQPYLTGQQIPPSPEALMRSRYSAFCSKNLPYLLSTRLPELRNQDDESQILKTFEQTQWLRLEVLDAKTSANQGMVEFIAYYKQDSEDVGQLHERSEFVLQNNRWFYADGRHLPPKKFHRNDACWCGSGKKLKKCCGR